MCTYEVLSEAVRCSVFVTDRALVTVQVGDRGDGHFTFSLPGGRCGVCLLQISTQQIGSSWKWYDGNFFKRIFKGVIYTVLKSE